MLLRFNLSLWEWKQKVISPSDGCIPGSKKSLDLSVWNFQKTWPPNYYKLHKQTNYTHKHTFWLFTHQPKKCVLDVFQVKVIEDLLLDCSVTLICFKMTIFCEYSHSLFSLLELNTKNAVPRWYILSFSQKVHHAATLLLVQQPMICVWMIQPVVFGLFMAVYCPCSRPVAVFSYL